MSLKIKGWRKITKIVVGALLGLLFLIFFIRVVTFEDAYYREKEGSERAEVPSSTQKEKEPELVEVKPTEAEVHEYTVAPGRPRYLTIEKISVYNARIVPVSINDEGEMGTPNNIYDVGWYESSGAPGAGRTMVIDGHNGGPHAYGVFKDLPEVVESDIIKVERGDGTVFQYRVVESKAILLDEANEYMATAMRSPEPGRESLTLITCTGEWSLERATYLSRQFVRAVLVTE